MAGGSRRPVRSLVVGRPILLALEDIDGSPSFLEKALRHVEAYGRLPHLGRISHMWAAPGRVGWFQMGWESRWWVPVGV